MSTADAILNTLNSFHLVDEGGGKYRSDSPLRPGSNSHAFCLKIDGPEHGTWIDQVSGEGGSLYDLADKLGIPTPTAKAPQTSKRGYDDLADYALAHGVPAGAYTAWSWTEATRDGRPALQFPTANGPRWRFLDGAKPTFTSQAGYTACWYGLAEAIALASATGQPLVFCNGEPSVVAAQHWGVPACCATNSGEKLLTQKLLAELQAAWSGSILIALDCDAKGRTAAPKLAAQVTGQVVDLGGSDGFDLADFCHLYQSSAMAELQQRAQPLPPPSSTPAPIPTTVSARILAACQQLGYGFRLNLLADDIEVNGVLMTDVTRAQIRTALRDLGVGPIQAYDDVMMTEAARHAYHPIQEYLDSLTWDGVTRIPMLASCLNGTDAPMVYDDGRQVPLVELYLTRWLIGAVAKVYEQAQNLMLVFVGPQGAGKSTFARWLAARLDKLYFIEAPIDVSDKDTDVRLMNLWIWEVGELDATTRKADVSALKDFITRKVVTVRKAYGRHDVRKPAMASLIGTVNESDGFLADSSGNRRFLVATIGTIDMLYQQIDIDQVWAEAMARYRAGETWRLNAEEAEYQHEINKQHETEDPIEGYIDRYFWFDPSDTEGMTTADIIDALRSKDVPVNMDKSWMTRIGAALRKRGLRARQERNGTQRARRYYGIVKASM